MSGKKWALLLLTVTALGGVWLSLIPREPLATLEHLVAAMCVAPDDRDALAALGVASIVELGWRGNAELERLVPNDVEDRVSRFRSMYPVCHVRFESPLVTTLGQGTWLVTGEVAVETQPFDLHARRWGIQARFRERNGKVALDRVLIDAPLELLPEARP